MFFCFIKPNMSFIQSCIEKAEIKQNYDVMAQYEAQLNRIQVFDDKMHTITDMYYNPLKDAILYKSERGIQELYFNFRFDDFKFNLPNTGNPRKMCSIWISEMTNPESKYLIDNETGIKRQHFKGLKWDVWGNGAFTTHFTW